MKGAVPSTAAARNASASADSLRGACTIAFSSAFEGIEGGLFATPVHTAFISA